MNSILLFLSKPVSWLAGYTHGLKEINQEIEAKEDWTAIHPQFAEESYGKKTYQQWWKIRGLTARDAQDWIPLGFTPKDYWAVENWKNNSFTPAQAQVWLARGYHKSHAGLVAHLRDEVLEIDWPTNNNYAQVWLDWQYPTEGTCIRKDDEWGDDYENYGKTRAEIKELDIGHQNLTGELDLSTFSNLEKLNCPWNQLTSLNLTNCSQLRELDCAWNQLTQLILPPQNRIRKIDAGKNLLTTFPYEQLNTDTLTDLLNLGHNNLATDLNVFSHLVNLRELWIHNNPIQGSCESLKQMNKLEKLVISDTDINAGVEYLPVSISKLECYTDQRPNAKVKEIEKELNLFGRMNRTEREAWQQQRLAQIEIPPKNNCY